MKTLKPLLSATFLAVTAASSHATVTPLGSSLLTSIDANAGATPAQNSWTVSQGTTLNSLSNSINVQALNGGLSATVASSETASWSSASSGIFTIDDSFSTGNLSAYTSSRVAVDGSTWTYTLSSDVAATLTLNYSVGYSGPYSYSALLYFQQIQGGSVIEQSELAGFSQHAPTSGTVKVALAANTDYSFQVFDDSNLNQQLSAFNSSMTGNFSFQITPVPEPSSLALAGMAALMFLRGRKVGRRQI